MAENRIEQVYGGGASKTITDQTSKQKINQIGKQDPIRYLQYRGRLRMNIGYDTNKLKEYETTI